MGRMSDFRGVVREFFGGFGNARFARFVIGDDEVPRLHIDAGGAVAQGGFDMGEVFGSDFFGRVERLGAVSLADDFCDVHEVFPVFRMETGIIEGSSERGNVGNWWGFRYKVGKTQTLAYEKGRLKRDVTFQTTFFPLQAISAG